ncbi:MAG: hypothetical protein AAF685_05145 [Cyanobacteria bacterium P01_C01_bin.89]
MAQYVERLPFDWDIKSFDYMNGMFCVAFHDGTRGTVPVSCFSALDGVSEADLSEIDVCVWHATLYLDEVEWEVSEAQLYEIVNGRDARNQAQKKYLEQRGGKNAVSIYGSEKSV